MQYSILEPFGEVGAIFTLQFSSQIHFAKKWKKKLSLKINVKNIRKIEFMTNVIYMPRNLETFFYTFIVLPSSRLFC